MERYHPETHSPVITGEFTEATLTPEQIKNSIQRYNKYRETEDQAIKIGLYGIDLENAMNDHKTTFLAYEDTQEEQIFMPLFVPVEKLEWYNAELLRRKYGTSELLYFAHPILPNDPQSLDVARESFRDKLNQGAVIFFDYYQELPENMEPHPIFNEVVGNLGNSYVSESLGEGDIQRKADVFIGRVDFHGVNEIKKAPPLSEVYKMAVAKGEIEHDSQNGASLLEVIDDVDADRIWEVYEKPFDILGAEHPTRAGFDKATLLEILKDPEVAKIINRVDGQITSLCFFVQDFDQCDWFNKKYYEDKFPEYYQTNNILLFPGIVSDEKLKGSSYSGRLIDLAVRLFAMRGSNALISFECTEISATYIPKIVTRIINNSGVGTVSELDKVVSSMTYKAIQKVSSPCS